jgi:hypothetical protein
VQRIAGLVPVVLVFVLGLVRQVDNNLTTTIT